MFERQLIFLEVVPSIVNPVNKLYSLAYQVQQTFFVPAKKPWISEQHDTSFLLTKYYSYWNVFYLVKIRNLSLASIWSFYTIAVIAEKKSSAIIAIIRKPLTSDRNDRSDNERWDIKSSISVIIVAAIARKWFPYDRYDLFDRWTFFSQRSQRS